jgi:DNA polymerase-3 subunit delta'
MQRILGHDTAISTFEQALRAGRMHHAWIISGPTGVGKCTLAREVALVLLDPDAGYDTIGREIPPTSQAARLLKSGSHPDLHIIHRELAASSSNPRLRERKQMNIPLDLLRESMLGGRTGDGRIHEAAAYRTSSLAPAKVFIIDEAERLDLPGQNALLKTLEEPPPSTYLFLVTARPERLLPTIWSRCQHVRLAALDQDDMNTWIETSGLHVEPDEREAVLDFSEGSPGMATRAARGGLSEWIPALEPLLTQLDRGGWSPEITTCMAERIDLWSKAVVKENPRASKDAANREGAEMMFRVMLQHVCRTLRSETDGRDLERRCRTIDRIAEAESQCMAGLNMKHVLEALTAEWGAVDR